MELDEDTRAVPGTILVVSRSTRMIDAIETTEYVIYDRTGQSFALIEDHDEKVKMWLITGQYTEYEMVTDKDRFMSFTECETAFECVVRMLYKDHPVAAVQFPYSFYLH